MQWLETNSPLPTPLEAIAITVPSVYAQETLWKPERSAWGSASKIQRDALIGLFLAARWADSNADGGDHGAA
jgi:hypothetical protein